jgi:hypothetical protein
VRKVWHPYWDWEDYKAGMWSSVKGKDRATMLRRAIEFTGDAVLYGSFMRRVAAEWPISCEHNLTDSAINRQAWIGHAACCMATGCPEDVTREAWGELTQQQQSEADAQAASAIAGWENARKDRKVHQDVGAQGLPLWDSR